jgi:hypothetical protein
MFASEVHRGDDVGGINTARDQARLPIDHLVVDPACHIVVFVTEPDKLAPQGGLPAGNGRFRKRVDRGI